jgi:hypothetical protein
MIAKCALAVALLCLSPDQGNCRERRWIKPVFESEVRSLSRAEADLLLSDFCGNKLLVDPGLGLTCSTRTLPTAAFADIMDNSFHPEGVIYGHFLSDTSDDAVVNGSSFETHPALWGGTLLLTRTDGVWHPLWYKSSVITRFCRKLLTPSGRHILLCEEEDAGMGAQVHYLYALDLKKPADLRDSPLATTRSFNDGCTRITQVIRRIGWDADKRRLRVWIATPEWSYSSSPVCEGNLLDHEKRPPGLSVLTFDLSDSGFHRVAPRKSK